LTFNSNFNRKIEGNERIVRRGRSIITWQNYSSIYIMYNKKWSHIIGLVCAL